MSSPLKVVPVYLRADQLRLLVRLLRDENDQVEKERDKKPELNRGDGAVSRILDEAAEGNKMLRVVLESKLAELEAE